MHLGAGAYIDWKLALGLAILKCMAFVTHYTVTPFAATYTVSHARYNKEMEQFAQLHISLT